MAQITSDLVKETTTTNGTGAKTLAGVRAPAARTVASVMANGDTAEFCISHDTLNEWEIGIYTYASGPNTLTLVGSPLASSNGGAAVNFSAGTKKVDLVLSATRIRRLVGPVAAGGSSIGSGSLSFSNDHGVSFGMSTDSAGGTVTASINTVGAGSSIAVVSHEGGNAVSSVTRIGFRDNSNVTWSLSTQAGGATVIAQGLGGGGGGGLAFRASTGLVGTSNFTDTTISVNTINLRGISASASLLSYANVLWGVNSANAVLGGFAFQRYNAQGVFEDAQVLSFVNSNSVTLGLDSTTTTNDGKVMRLTASFAPILGLVSHVGGNSQSNITRLAFSNASNVTWSMSTGAGAATVIAAVASTFDCIRSISLGTAPTALTAATESSFSGLLLNFQQLSTQTSVFSSANVSFGFSSNSLVAAAGINVSAGGSSATVQHIAFQNVGGGASFGLSTTTFANFGRFALITASVPAQTSLSFSNLNGVTFGTAGSTLTASVSPNIGVVSHVGGDSATGVTRLAFSDNSNVTWSASTAANAVTMIASVAAGGGGGAANTFSLNSVGTNRSSLTAFTDSVITTPNVYLPLMATSNNTNLSQANVVFRMSSESLYAAAYMHFFRTTNAEFSGQHLWLRDGINGNSWSFNTTTIANYGRVVYFDLRAAVAISAGTLFQFAQNLGFADSNGASFSYAGSQISLNYAAPRAISAGGASATDGTVVFSNSNGVSFGMNAGTITASVAAGGGGIAASAAGSSQSNGTVVWSNSNNVSFGMNGSTITASASLPVLAISAAGASISAGTAVWSNANNVSFGQAGSTITASATVAATRDIGVVSHVGGNVVSSVSLLAFSNDSNVTFNLSTAANAATLRASVNAGGGGITYDGYIPYQGEFVTQTLGNGSFMLSPMWDVPAFEFDRVVGYVGVINTSNSTNSNTLRYIAGIYTRGTGASVSLVSLLSSTSGSHAYTGSGTQGNYSLFSGTRIFTIGWTGTLQASDYWLGVGIFNSTAGNAGITANIGLFSQTNNNTFAHFNSATNNTIQSILGKGVFSASVTQAPQSIAFNALNGTVVNGQRFPAFWFGSGTA